MKKILLILVLCFITLLCGCSSNGVEPSNVVTIQSCMAENYLSPSVKGENITYYYMNSDEISLYYSTNWKKGVISWIRYFANEEQYNLQKSIYPNAKCDDAKRTIFVKEYLTVSDMEAHWNSIENSGVYTIVK